MRISYALTPALSPPSSGDKLFHGRITKTGNNWLRWAAIKAAQTAVWNNPEFHDYYQHIRMKKGSNTAKVATGRQLMKSFTFSEPGLIHLGY